MALIPERPSEISGRGGAAFGGVQPELKGVDAGFPLQQLTVMAILRSDALPRVALGHGTQMPLELVALTALIGPPKAEAKQD